MEYEEARKKLEALCERETPLIFVVGGPGTGKTHLLLDLEKTLDEHGYVVMDDYDGTFADGTPCRCDMGPEEIVKLLTSEDAFDERGPVDGPLVLTTHVHPRDRVSPERLRECAIDIETVPVVELAPSSAFTN